MVLHTRFRLASRSLAASKADASGAAPVAERMSATRIAAQLVRERGLLGLYKGYTPTFLRDVGFSMLYFPLFAHLNRLVRCAPLLLYSSTLHYVYVYDRSCARTSVSGTACLTLDANLNAADAFVTTELTPNQFSLEKCLSF